MNVPPGSLRIASIGGVPVSFHWSVGLVVLVMPFFSRLDPLYSFCSLVAYALLLGAHEFAHFASARAFGLKVHAVHFRAMDAYCRIEPPRSVRAGLWVFSAGLMAQFLILVTAIALLVAFQPPRGPVADSAFKVLVILNVLMILDNAIPRKASSGLSNDGQVLSDILSHAKGRGPDPFRSATLESTLFPADTTLLSLEGFAPPGFRQGIEILNDEKTPMDFVVESLARHLGLAREDAIQLMFRIHVQGGVLHPMPSVEAARSVAAAMATESAAAGHPLVSRAVQRIPDAAGE